MDTYRQMRYNRSTMERVSPFFGRPQEVNNMSVSEAQKKASIKYLEKLDEIRIRMPKGQKDIIKTHAESRGESVNGFINRAIEETMERDNTPGGLEESASPPPHPSE